MNQDLEHLRLLAIFHYVVAAMAALVACFPLIHLTIGLVFLLAPESMQNGHPTTLMTPKPCGWLEASLLPSLRCSLSPAGP